MLVKGPLEVQLTTWQRRGMDTIYALLTEGNLPIGGAFPSQIPLQLEFVNIL